MKRFPRKLFGWLLVIALVSTVVRAIVHLGGMEMDPAIDTTLLVIQLVSMVAAVAVWVILPPVPGSGYSFKEVRFLNQDSDDDIEDIVVEYAPNRNPTDAEFTTFGTSPWNTLPKGTGDVKQQFIGIPPYWKCLRVSYTRAGASKTVDFPCGPLMPPCDHPSSPFDHDIFDVEYQVVDQGGNLMLTATFICNEMPKSGATPTQCPPHSVNLGPA